jgi:tRNA threonylcarbamoyladenosine biosynthesis protein TsaE
VTSPGSTLRVRSHGVDETERLAREMVPLVPVRAVVGLVGPLGAGKTCFVRGLAEGLGVDDRDVTSPTFVYLVDYGTTAGILSHADLYRLGDLPEHAAEEVFESIGLLAAFETSRLTAVEWWEHYRGPLPEQMIVVEFEIENIEDRTISLDFRGPGLAQARQFLAERWSAVTA